MKNRRQFLQSTAVGIAAASLAKPQNKSADSMVDWHGHWIGPTVVELMSKRKTAPLYVINEKREIFAVARGSSMPAANARPQESSWFDIDQRLRALDEAGVQRQVLSWGGATYDGALSPDEARPMWMAQNDDIAAVVKKHPARFSGLATLPTADVTWAAEELERAHRDLGLIGATLPLDAFVSLEGAKALVPVFAVAQKYHSHIFVHRNPAAANIPGELPEAGTTNPYFGLPAAGRGGAAGDATVARTTLMTSTHLATGVITLALTDFLDAYPDVSVQIAMMGGSIAFVAGQIEFAEEAAGRPSSTRKLRRVYLDTGQFGRVPRNIAFAAQIVGADRILFGSDYGPSASIVPYVEAVKSATLTPAEKEAILSGNARTLLAAKGVRA
ncbi:MAG: amidohydrolase family protein [Bryobacteraceae bacterium]|jgi:predicted TIM-barrel fold metal-dependent hydrolase